MKRDDKSLAEIAESEAEAQLAIIRALKPLDRDGRHRVMNAARCLIESNASADSLAAAYIDLSDRVAMARALAKANPKGQYKERSYGRPPAPAEAHWRCCGRAAEGRKMTEEELTKCAEQQDNTCGTKSAVGYAGSGPAQPNLRERVAYQLQRAQQEARKSERLRELSRLLDKYPDAARILDLVEEVRY